MTGKPRVPSSLLRFLASDRGDRRGPEHVRNVFRVRRGSNRAAAFLAMTVDAWRTQRQAKYEVKSNGAGAFEFVGLPPGDYMLEVTVWVSRAQGSRQDCGPRICSARTRSKLGGLEETITVRFRSGDRSTAGDDAIGRREQGRCRHGHQQVRCVTDGGRIVPPRKIRDVIADLSRRPARAGTEGTVVMRGRIGVDGYRQRHSEWSATRSPSLAQCGASRPCANGVHPDAAELPAGGSRR